MTEDKSKGKFHRGAGRLSGCFRSRNFSAPVITAVSAALLFGGVFAVPGASRALGEGFRTLPVSLSARGAIGSFTPASIDPRLADQLHLTSLRQQALNGQTLFRFTPASTDGKPRKPITVAVRVNSAPARVVAVRNMLADSQPGRLTPALKITPAAYNLGMARGYESFAPTKFTLPTKNSGIELPDLAAFDRTRKSDQGSSSGEGRIKRLGGHIELAETQRTGRAPRTLEGAGDVSVDVAGSYKITRNLDVTAGVRYSRDRDRIAPLAGNAQDKQAVYVGTQIRF